MTSEYRNYVAAWVDYRRNGDDRIIVLERDQDSKLYRKVYNPPYYFYVPDEEGEYESIFGDKLIKAEFDSKDAYNYAKNQFPVKFESDIAPLKRVLMDNYYGIPAPPVHYALIDIETDYSQEIGFASPNVDKLPGPYAPINAVTVYQSWSKKFLTYAVPPPQWKGTVKEIYHEFDKLVSLNQLEADVRPEITICLDERELISKMLESMSDADIISGWNSEFYDLPYICERLIRNGGDYLLSRIDHIGAPKPKKELVNKFGSEEPIYKLMGKSHLDYLALFKKFTFEGRTSYSLGNVLQEEIGLGKLSYDGTLEQLYKNNFPLFVNYNFRDISGLVQLDEKFKFIALVNQMAHENTVDFSAMLGTVSYVETGITNHTHNVLKKIVHDKNIVDHDKVEGAIVMTPQIGLHEWIGAVDIRSLYPNVIRSINISPEMFMGQFTTNEKAWEDIYLENDNRHTLACSNGESITFSALEWKQILKDKDWAISAHGSIFDQSRGNGVVPDVLGFWYRERQRLQAEKKKWTKKIKESIDEKEIAEAKKQEEYFNLLQTTKKISMNSLFGATLNAAFRFGSESMGASVTATGRKITTHMIETIGEAIAGEYHPLVKSTSLDKDGKFVHEYSCKSDAVIYGDTDSVFMKTYAANKEDAIKIADQATEIVNKSFPTFMTKAFNCGPDFNGFISANREIVGIRGLFQRKKKYVVRIVDLEGIAVDKKKTMGSEIKKADTPKIIQNFLEKTVDLILDGAEYDTIATFVNKQRKEILKNKGNAFLTGVAKQVNNLDKFQAEYNNPGTIRTESGNKLTIPGHVRASLNYNLLLDVFDRGAKQIKSGDKVVIFYLKPNQYNFDALAFPSEFVKFPKWFEENFAVDIKKTEDRLFDSKLAGIFAALGKDVPSPQSVLTNSIVQF